MDNKNTNKKTKTNYVGWLIFLIILVVAIWGISGVVLFKYEERGKFGDMFGAVNALFSGLAFVGVIYAILLQRQELEFQRKELKLTRKEIKGQKQQLKAQNKTMKLQRFENTFFQLLGLHNDIVNQIDLRTRDKITTARDCFCTFFNRFSRSYTSQYGMNQNENVLEKLNDVYLERYKGFQADVGHYFRNLYNIVKFVKNSEFEEKKLYTNMIRAQLSSFELGLLFYNCLSEMGKEKFKPLVEEFGLLKNLDKTILISEEHTAFYNESAFT